MKKSTLIMLAVLVVLAGATYLVMQRPGEQSSSGSNKVLVEFDSAAVDKIDIRSESGAVTLEKVGGEWMMTSPLRYRADKSSVASALGSAHHIVLSSLISTNPQKQHLFLVDSTGTLVRLMDRDAERAAFRVGKMGPSYTETYVRKEGTDDVYLSEGMIGPTFSRRPNDWRDKSIFKADQASVTSVAFRYGDTLFTVAFKDSAWTVDDAKASSQSVSSFLSALTNLAADEFVDTTVAVMPKLAAQIEVGGTQIRLFPLTPGDRTYVQTSATPQLFLINNWRAQQILKRKNDFLPPA
jgi:hypothetical protein